MANKRVGSAKILVAGITWENIARIIRAGIYDTDLYRYVYVPGPAGDKIRRISIRKVGTQLESDAHNWETVYYRRKVFYPKHY